MGKYKNPPPKAGGSRQHIPSKVFIKGWKSAVNLAIALPELPYNTSYHEANAAAWQQGPYITILARD